MKLMGLKLTEYPSWSIVARCLMVGILILERRMLARFPSVLEKHRLPEQSHGTRR